MDDQNIQQDVNEILKKILGTDSPPSTQKVQADTSISTVSQTSVPAEPLDLVSPQPPAPVPPQPPSPPQPPVPVPPEPTTPPQPPMPTPPEPPAPSIPTAIPSVTDFQPETVAESAVSVEPPKPVFESPIPAPFPPMTEEKLPVNDIASSVTAQPMPAAPALPVEESTAIPAFPEPPVMNTPMPSPVTSSVETISTPVIPASPAVQTAPVSAAAVQSSSAETSPFEGVGMGKYKVVVLKDKCIGAASCVAVAPKAFKLNDQQIAEVLPTVNQENDENLLLAAQSCPTLAIEVYDTTTGEKVWPK